MEDVGSLSGYSNMATQDPDMCGQPEGGNMSGKAMPNASPHEISDSCPAAQKEPTRKALENQVLLEVHQVESRSPEKGPLIFMGLPHREGGLHVWEGNPARLAGHVGENGCLWSFGCEKTCWFSAGNEGKSHPLWLYT